MIMETARRILPGILDIDSDIVKALNLNSRNPKGKLPGGDLYHFCWRGGGRFGRSDLNDLLRQDLPLIGECRQRLRGQDLHPGHQILYRRVRIRVGGEERPISVGFDLEAQNEATRLIALRLEFSTVVQIEVAHSFFRRQINLLAADVVLVAVHDGPKVSVAGATGWRRLHSGAWA